MADHWDYDDIEPENHGDHLFYRRPGQVCWTCGPNSPNHTALLTALHRMMGTLNKPDMPLVYWLWCRWVGHSWREEFRNDDLGYAGDMCPLCGAGRQRGLRMDA